MTHSELLSTSWGEIDHREESFTSTLIFTFATSYINDSDDETVLQLQVISESGAAVRKAWGIIEPWLTSVRYMVFPIAGCDLKESDNIFEVIDELRIGVVIWDSIVCTTETKERLKELTGQKEPS